MLSNHPLCKFYKTSPINNGGKKFFRIVELDFLFDSSKTLIREEERGGSLHHRTPLRQKLTSPNDIKDNKGSRAKISYERASRHLKNMTRKYAYQSYPKLLDSTAASTQHYERTSADPILMQNFWVEAPQASLDFYIAKEFHNSRGGRSSSNAALVWSQGDSTFFKSILKMASNNSWLKDGNEKRICVIYYFYIFHIQLHYRDYGKLVL